tara:strand:- start:54 stop:260 length:207 start_codon:yes stop_codon:yes gene_type:complete
VNHVRVVGVDVHVDVPVRAQAQGGIADVDHELDKIKQSRKEKVENVLDPEEDKYIKKKLTNTTIKINI